MGKQIRDFKVRDVVEAIEKNGFEHLRGTWLDTSGGSLTGGCVLGQGAINLGVVPDLEAMEEIVDVADDIEFNEEFTLYKQLDRFVNVSPKWQSNIATYAKTCGAAIVFFNDEKDDDNGGYALKTYEAVTQMVKDILAPYLDETVTLQVWDYSEWIVPSNFQSVLVNA